MAAFRNTLRDVLLFLLFAISLCHASSILKYGIGVLEAKNGINHQSFCAVFYPNLTSYPNEKEDGVYEPLLDMSTSWNACNYSLPDEAASIKGHIILVQQPGNCSVIEKAETVKRLGGKGIILVSENLLDLPANDTYPAVIPIAFIWQDSKDILMRLTGHVEVYIYSPILKKLRFDYSLIALTTLAMLSVGIGGYWSGLERNRSMRKKAQNATVDSNDEFDIEITPLMKAILIVCLLSFGAAFLYLILCYTIWFFIGIFVIGSTVSFYSCLEPLFHLIPIGSIKLPFYNSTIVRVQLHKLVLFIVSVMLVTCWTVFRNESFAWILQDILSFFSSVFFISKFSFPSLKVSTIFLTFYVFLEILAIYIPLLYITNEKMANGQAALIESSSNGVQEQMPMVFRFPYFDDPLSVCRSQQQYSRFGLENILIPGMVVGFCHAFDLARALGSKIYFGTTLVAYGFGWCAIYIGFSVTATPQHALLYLIPLTLTPVFIIGLCRRELKILWQGHKVAYVTMENKAQLTEVTAEESGEYAKVSSILFPPNLSNSKWSLPSSLQDSK